MKTLNYIFMALAALSSLTIIIIGIITNKPFESWSWPLATLAWVIIAFMNTKTIEGYERREKTTSKFRK